PKPTTLVSPETPIDLVGEPRRYVSRGAYKLSGALDAFAIDVEGRRALDAGASTGGFTQVLLERGASPGVARALGYGARDQRLRALDAFAIDVEGRRALDAGVVTGGFTQVLLERGASEVVALDVGYGQLDQRLRDDERVVVMERTNLRHVTPEDTGGRFSMVVADLSFISLCTVAPALARLADDDADLVLLIKPQFEAGKGEVGRGGIVRDDDVRRRAVEKALRCLTGEGLTPVGIVPSPITGADGNREFLAWCRPGADVVELEVLARSTAWACASGAATGSSSPAGSWPPRSGPGSSPSPSPKSPRWWIPPSWLREPPTWSSPSAATGRCWQRCRWRSPTTCRSSGSTSGRSVSSPK